MFYDWALLQLYPTSCLGRLRDAEVHNFSRYIQPELRNYDRLFSPWNRYFSSFVETQDVQHDLRNQPIQRLQN